GSYYRPGGSGSTVATGSATLTYAASQTPRSMTVTVRNVHLPDGLIMRSVITENARTAPGPHYPTEAPPLIGDPTLIAGNATVSGSTGNGDNVPVFGTIGFITVHAINPVTGQDLGLVVSGSCNLTAAHGGGGGGGGNP